MAVKKQSFGKLSDGTEVFLYTIINEKGESVSVTEYGASVVAINIRDRERNLRDIALGCSCAADYEEQTACLGGVPGRHANRIGKGRFVLNGEEYSLAVNNGPNHLHGGPTGFHRRVWYGKVVDDDSVVFSRLSTDGEESYPGNLMVSVKYTFTNKGRLVIRYKALADRDTVVNLTNHTYFNLNGHDSGSVNGQYLHIWADSFTENDSDCLPTGRVVSLDSEEGKAMDFREDRTIGEKIEEDNIHLKNGSGYDHNYILENRKDGLAARAYSKESGICMECYTTQPGVQFYTGNFLSSSNIRGKDGAAYQDRDGFCLETQHFPNAMACPQFPSVVLKAGELYKEKTEYLFSVME